MAQPKKRCQWKLKVLWLVPRGYGFNEHKYRKVIINASLYQRYNGLLQALPTPRNWGKQNHGLLSYIITTNPGWEHTTVVLVDTLKKVINIVPCVCQSDAPALA